MGNLKQKGVVQGGLRWKERAGKISRGISKAMAWFAIVERKSMSPKKALSKGNQITTNILNILNALGAEKPIFYNLKTIHKDWGTK